MNAEQKHIGTAMRLLFPLSLRAGIPDFSPINPLLHSLTPSF